MLKRRFPEPEASGGSAKRARQLDRDRESLQQQGHRVARSQVEGIPRAWRLQIIDRERLVEPGTQIVCVEERLWYQQVPVEGEFFDPDWIFRSRGKGPARQAKAVKYIAFPLWKAFVRAIARRNPSPHSNSVRRAGKAGLFERLCGRVKCQEEADRVFLPTLAQRCVLSVLLAAQRQASGLVLQPEEAASAGSAARIILRAVFVSSEPVKSRRWLKNPAEVYRQCRTLAEEFSRIVQEQVVHRGGWGRAFCLRSQFPGWPANLVGLLLLAGKHPAPCLIPSPRILESAFDEETVWAAKEELIDLGCVPHDVEELVELGGLLASGDFHQVKWSLWQCRGGLSDPRRVSEFAQARVRQRIAGLCRRQELCLQFVIGGFAEGYPPYQLAHLGAECVRDLSWLGGDIVAREWLRSVHPGWDSWIWHPCAADRSEWLREPECRVEVELHVLGDRVVVELCESSLRVDELACAFVDELINLSQ